MSRKPSLFGEPGAVQRFPMALDRFWRWATILGGATRDNSYVDIGPENVRFRYGWFFDRSFPLSDVEQASAVRTSWLMGVGWHTDLVGGIELISARRNVVEVRFRTSRWVWMLIPARCRRIHVSVEDPRALLDALAARGALVIS